MRNRPIPLLAIIVLMLTAPAFADINSTVVPSVGSATSCSFSGATCVANRPPSTISGHLLLFCEYDSGSPGTTLTLTGFTQVSQFTYANTPYFSRATCFDKVATGSEPSSYTLTDSSAPGIGDGVLMDLANVGATPISGTPGGLASSSGSHTYTIPAATGTAPQSLNIVCGSQSNPQTVGIANAIQVGTTGYNAMTTCWSYMGAPTSATVTATGASGYLPFGEQIAIAPLQVSTGSNIALGAIQGFPTGFSADVAAGTRPYSSAAKPLTGYGLNGCFNPVAYGADPSGATDSSAAFNAVVAPACAGNLPVNASTTGPGTICIPPGTYRLDSQPWLVQCASGNLPNIVGAGRGTVIFENNLGHNTAGGGPAIEIASSLQVSDLAANGPIKPALVGTGNSWNNTVSHPFVFDLNYPLAGPGLSIQPLNGQSAFTVETCFSTTTNSATEVLSASDGGATPVAEGCAAAGPPTYGGNAGWTCKGAYWFGLGDNGELYGSMNIGGAWTGLFHSSSAVGANTTVCAQMSYDGSYVRLFHGAPGATMTEDAKVAASGAVTERQDEDLTMLAASSYWHLIFGSSAGFWQGQIDTFRISKVARCTNDSGCTAPNAKLSGDSNTLFLENWTNVSNLPLVGPEYLNGDVQTLGPTTQGWMVAQDQTSGNPAGNHPTVSGFTVGGAGAVSIHMNVAAPQFRDVEADNTWGFVAPVGNSYGIIGHDLWGSGMVPAIFNSGLTYLYGMNFSCGLTCGEFSGPEVSGLSILTGGAVKWGIIVDGWAHLDSFYDDAEGGGTYPAIQVSNFAPPAGPSLTCINCQPINQGNVAQIVLDGETNTINIVNSILNAASGYAMVDATNSAGSNDVVFDNDTYNGNACPPAGTSFTTGTAQFEARGSCAIKQTTLSGTTAGTAVWSEPVISTGQKKFRVYLNGYENTTATPQTIAMPAAFATVISTVETVSGTCTGITATTSTVTLPSSMGATQTGLCEFDGY